jgi:DNA-binding beta-propeller fold protein YncE
MLVLAPSSRAGSRRNCASAAIAVALALAAVALAVAASAPAAETLATFRVVGAPGTEPGQLRGPIDLTLDPAGNVIVADTDNHRVQKFSADGTLVWARGKADGTAGNGPGEFRRPKDVAVAPDMSVVVADSDNSRIQRLTADGSFVTAYPQMFSPQSISVDADGSMFSVDTSGDRVHKLSSAGAVVKTWGGTGDQPGKFKAPFDASVAGGFVYVADGDNSRVQKFTNGGDFVKLWGTRARDPEKPKPGEFLRPTGISATSDGRVYVIDRDTNRLDEFTTEGEFRLRFGDARQLTSPGGVFALGSSLAVADTGRDRVVMLIRAETPAAGTFCDSTTGTCATGPNGVPTVTMPSGDRSDVRFVNPRDACERLGAGAHLQKQAFFNGKTYVVQKVAEGFMVEIPAADLVASSLIVRWTCRSVSPKGAHTAQFTGGVVDENWGDVALVDPSGFVRDSRTRKGIPGATVTLHSSPTFSGPFAFTDPLSISPRVNPQVSDRRGHYGWDVPQGSYRISVKRFGYRTLRASRIVSVPPPVTDLHVRLRRNASEQARLIEPKGSVGRLRLGMSRAEATRVAKRLRPRPRLRFRRGRLVSIELSSGRYRTGPGIGVTSTEAGLHLAYGRKAKRKGSRYRLGRASFVVSKANGATGKVRRVIVAR